jgi:hypothetical protein
MKFFASINGIDLDAKSGQSSEEAVQRVKDRVAARQKGVNPEKYELQEHFLTDYEVEE